MPLKKHSVARYAAAVLLLALSQPAPAYGEDYYPAPDAQAGWRTLTDSAKIRNKTGVDTADRKSVV